MIYRSVYRNVRGWAWTRDCLLSKPDNIGCFAVQLWFFSWIVLQTTTKWLLACFVLVFSPYSLHRAMLVVCNYTVESSRVLSLLLSPQSTRQLFICRPIHTIYQTCCSTCPTKYVVVRQRTQLETIQFHSICSAVFLKWYVSSKWRRWEMVAVL